MTLLPGERVIEVAVGAQRPAVVLDQGGDQAGFVVFVKPDWTGVRRLFWTGLPCSRHRYTRDEIPSRGWFFHSEGTKKTYLRVWPGP